MWSEKEPVTCSTCHVVISKSYFWRHRQLCTAVVMKKTCSLLAPIPLRVAQQEKQDMWDDFLRKILSRFRANEMGILCKTDDTITMIGLKLFQGVEVRYGQHAKACTALTTVQKCQRKRCCFVRYAAQRKLSAVSGSCMTCYHRS